MSGLFQNLLYPDNPNRVERVAQLAQDCRLFVGLLRSAFAQLGQANDRLKDLQASACVTWCLAENGRQSHCFETSDYLAEHLQAMEAQIRLALAFTAQRQQEAGLEALDLFESHPSEPWLDIRDYYGLLPAAFDGASVRDELRAHIAALRRDRLRLACAMRRLRQAADNLSNASSFASAQRRAIATAEEPVQRITLEEIIRSYFEHLTPEQANEQTLAWLQALDESRSAWTLEDHYA